MKDILETLRIRLLRLQQRGRRRRRSTGTAAVYSNGAG